MVDTMVGRVTTGDADHGPVIAAVRNTLTNNALDPAFIAEAVLLPSESFLGDQMLVVDPDAIHDAREALRADIGRDLADLWRAAYAAQTQPGPFVYSPEAKGARRLRNVALGYIAASGAADAADVAFRQFEASDNMTDRQGALGTLVKLVRVLMLGPVLLALSLIFRDRAPAAARPTRPSARTV